MSIRGRYIQLHITAGKYEVIQGKEMAFTRLYDRIGQHVFAASAEIRFVYTGMRQMYVSEEGQQILLIFRRTRKGHGAVAQLHKVRRLSGKSGFGTGHCSMCRVGELLGEERRLSHEGEGWVDGVQGWNGERGIASKAVTGAVVTLYTAHGRHGQAAIAHQSLHHGLDAGHARLHGHAARAGIALPTRGSVLVWQ